MKVHKTLLILKLIGISINISDSGPVLLRIGSKPNFVVSPTPTGWPHSNTILVVVTLNVCFGFFSLCLCINLVCLLFSCIMYHPRSGEEAGFKRMDSK